jgi:hypothetical protein
MRHRALYRDLKYIVTLGAIIIGLNVASALVHWWLFLLPVVAVAAFVAGRWCRPAPGAGTKPYVARSVLRTPFQNRWIRIQGAWRRFRYY